MKANRGFWLVTHSVLAFFVSFLVETFTSKDKYDLYVGL